VTFEDPAWLAQEARLLERIRRGDRAAFGALYHAFAAPLVNRVHEMLQVGYLAGAERQLDRMWRTLRQNQAGSSRLGQQMLQDVAFRLGQVMLEERKTGEALEVCTRGLALGEHDDLFTANLFILRGNIQQELGKSLAAAMDFHQALVINENLLHKVLHRLAHVSLRACSSLSRLRPTPHTGRTLSINGTAMSCNAWALPPKQHGGYCIQVTSGGQPSASYATW
jgi:hypothetical protein